MFFLKIKLWFFCNIIAPIIGWYKFIFYGEYIEDNERNQNLIEYCVNIMFNEDYEPSTPNEHYFEKQFLDMYKEYINLEENIDYKIFRSIAGQHTFADMATHHWVDTTIARDL